MKYIITLSFLFLTITSFGQNLETDNLWRTRGVYDSLGNFMEPAKIQSLLYISKPNQIQRLYTQDKINMETGETKVFVYQDTFYLEPLAGSTFIIDDKETLTIHSDDSLTINYNNFNISYVKLSLPKKKLDSRMVENALLDKVMRETIEGKSKSDFTFQKNGLVKISAIEGKYERESEYKLISFNGYTIIQGVVSAPKLVIGVQKKEIQFIEIDYRFDNKSGTLKEIS